MLKSVSMSNLPTLMHQVAPTRFHIVMAWFCTEAALMFLAIQHLSTLALVACALAGSMTIIWLAGRCLSTIVSSMRGWRLAWQIFALGPFIGLAVGLVACTYDMNNITGANLKLFLVGASLGTLIMWYRAIGEFRAGRRLRHTALTDPTSPELAQSMREHL